MARKIKNKSEEEFEIEVIRYFINNDIEYLIYSLNETDENGYVKLYASKIIDNVAVIITDSEEWNIIKEIIKSIVRSNRDGSELNVIDLDENYLDNITLQDTRAFKLQGNLVNLLSENKKVKITEPIKEEAPDISEFFEEEVIEENYEELYKKEIEKNKELRNEINDLNIRLEQFQTLFDKIKEIVQ